MKKPFLGFFMMLIIAFILTLTSCSYLHKDISKPIKDKKDLVSPLPSPCPPAFHPFHIKKNNPKVDLPENFDQNISLFITEKIPLREIFYEIARCTNTHIRINYPMNSDEHIYYVAKDLSLKNAVEDICKIAGLRFEYRSGTLIIKKDLPYVQNYYLQFLNLTRDTKNHMSVNTDVNATNPSSSASKTNGSSSHSSITVATKSNFWEDIEKSIGVLLSSEDNKSKYTINKQSGIVSIYGTKTQHDLIENYLAELKKVCFSQVLIEAKIIEVSLFDKFKAGVDWQKIKLAGNRMNINADFGSLPYQQDISGGNGFIMAGYWKDFNVVLSAISEFGTQKILSSPRLTVMNNQTAILKVAKNQVYFKLNYDNYLMTTSNFSKTTVSSEIKTVPIGVILSVQPSIDMETGKVTLSLRPTISRMTKSVSDPAVDIALRSASRGKKIDDATKSMIPIVEVNEIDSVLAINSGELAILGGLIDIRSNKANKRIPGLGDIPIIGEAFKVEEKSDDIVELVVLIKATIIDDGHVPPHPADNRVMSYIEDPMM